MQQPPHPHLPASNGSTPDATASQPPAPRAKRWTYKKGVHHFKVIDMLRPEDRKAYLEFIARPSTTVDGSVRWLADRGCVVGRDSVYRHRRHFLREAADVRRAAEFAHQFVELARGGDDASGPALAGAFAEATQTAFEQFFMNGVLEMKKRGRELEPRQWAELSRAVGGAVAARRQVEAMRADFADRARQAAEAVEQAGGTKKSFNGVAIANAVRRILGVPLPGEPYPPPGGIATPDDPLTRRCESAVREFMPPGDN